MDKLLHDELRECRSLGDLIRLVGFNEGELCTSKDTFTALADEIERSYIPRPRFDDGKPVQFGDRYGKAGHVVRRIIFREGGWTIDNDRKDKGQHFNSNTNEAVPRYRPVVLDADGEEIQIGDTVWGSDGLKLTVLFIQANPSDYAVFAKTDEGEEFYCDQKTLSHKEPDSLERIKADATLSACVYIFRKDIECSSQIDCKAGNVDKVYGCPHCEREVRKHLIGRMEALMEREK